MDDLNKYRKQIDSIDHSIIDLLAQRMRCVAKIGVIKKDQGIAPFDKKRWRALLEDRLEAGTVLGLSNVLIKQIWNSIHEHALEIEKNHE
ncbi:hypothetical protein COY16_01500 [Candidatus Roizmanbacteria bacterium CG_4_10_14_0_2_um_filter_39_13]|uniref:Chorismate mutase domain-containing protein n=1 Tax=Candidatus Roizmanbacteria bacterium CG_4_10_14_0_2_um_filter_39_13 TaxID=1974825 RepID=A0A2M7U0N1_9BACT|nr:MAG: hypothetical protein COY16_01500 [Candidatus Roizmanbacteria bacterium CG_4_10_14_0_2_um_filter_39_13]